MTLEERLCTKATINQIPISANFELSPICNMNCEMCYIRLDKKEADKYGKIRNADEWIELAKRLLDKGTMFILLTGGEPFIYQDFDKLYTALRTMGMIVTINSNGTMITERIADILQANKPRRVNVTLYGASEETYKRLCHYPGGFRRTIDGIKLLKAKGVDVKLNASITSFNKNEIEDLLKIADHFEIPMEIDTYMYPFFRKGFHKYKTEARLSAEEAANAAVRVKKYQMTESEFNEYKNTIEVLLEKGKTDELKNTHITCRAAKSSLWVSWQGDMQPCFALEEISINAFDNDFDTAWKYLTNKSEEEVIFNKCATCDYRFICDVCPGRIYTESFALKDKNNVNYEDEVNKNKYYLCEYTKKLIDEISKKN